MFKSSCPQAYDAGAEVARGYIGGEFWRCHGYLEEGVEMSGFQIPMLENKWCQLSFDVGGQKWQDHVTGVCVCVCDHLLFWRDPSDREIDKTLRSTFSLAYFRFSCDYNSRQRLPWTLGCLRLLC